MCERQKVNARDVFISHSSGNKSSHARPLEEALASHGVSAWVDEGMIEPGDSLVDTIGDGLRLATAVVVMVTEEFLESRWALRELASATARMVRTDETRVIPVLDVPPSTWFDAAPLLEDLLWLSWTEGATDVASRIAGVFRRDPAVEWAHNHPPTYTGLVWTRVTSVHEGPHRITLRWGPYTRVVDVELGRSRPVSLVHHKTSADSVTLHVTVDQPAIVTFGHGPAPDARPYAQGIDEGWTRAAGMSISTPAQLGDLPYPTERSRLASLLGVPPSVRGKPPFPPHASSQ